MIPRVEPIWVCPQTADLDLKPPLGDPKELQSFVPVVLRHNSGLSA